MLWNKRWRRLLRVKNRRFSSMSWDSLHNHYQKQDWSKKPSIFAEQVIDYFPKTWKILEIWAGIWQDSRYFHSLGYDLCSTDIGTTAVDINRENSEFEIKSWRYKVESLDILTWLTTIPDESYDIIYSHLSLHYFSRINTENILKNIRRILREDWLIVVLLNSVNDPEYGQGEKIEEDYFHIAWQTNKRYFSINSASLILGGIFVTIHCDDEGETYKDREKWIHNLIRYIGKKN